MSIVYCILLTALLAANLHSIFSCKVDDGLIGRALHSATTLAALSELWAVTHGSEINLLPVVALQSLLTIYHLYLRGHGHADSVHR